MWVYSVTTATSAHATEYRDAATASSFTSRSIAFPGFSASESVDATSSSAITRNAYGVTTRVAARQDSMATVQDAGGATTYSFTISTSSAAELAEGFSRTTSGSTSANSTGTTTASGETTAQRTLDTWLSGTESTTQAVVTSVSTTATATRTVVSTAAGPTTTAATVTGTITTSTASAGVGTTTVYQTAASASLTAPVSLVPVTASEVTEELWEVTVTADSAGYAEHLGTTVAARTGTVGTASTALPQASAATFTSTRLQLAGETLSLTTTSTRSVSDTYVPWASVLPATATATRSFTLLELGTTTLTRAVRNPVTVTVTCATAHFQTKAASSEMLTTGTVPVTYNVSPTATATGTWHVTWYTSASYADFSPRPAHGTSESGDFTASASTIETTESASTTLSTYTTTETQSSTGPDVTVVTTTKADGMTQGATTATSTATGSSLTTVESFTESTNELGTTSRFGTSVYSSWSVLDSTSEQDTVLAGVGTIYRTTSSLRSASATSSYETNDTAETGFGTDLLPVSTFGTTTSSTSTAHIDDTFTTGSVTYVATGTATATTATTATYSVTVTDTATTSTAVPTTETGTDVLTSSSSAGQSISYTAPVLLPQIAAANTQQWSALAMHPRPGFRAPLGLAATDALYSSLALAGLATVVFPFAATQDDSAGAVVPVPHTDAQRYTTGASVITAQWSTADSSLHVTTGVSETYTATELNGTTTASYTRTRTVSTATAAAGISAAAACTWYAPQLTSAASDGSRIGGLPFKSQFGLVVWQPPGVRHVTRQNTAGSTSSTTAETFLGFPTGSTFAEAYPTRTESAWSVGQRLTSWELDEFGLNTTSSGATARPLVTLSLNPNF